MPECLNKAEDKRKYHPHCVHVHTHTHMRESLQTHTSLPCRHCRYVHVCSYVCQYMYMYISVFIMVNSWSVINPGHSYTRTLLSAKFSVQIFFLGSSFQNASISDWFPVLFLCNFYTNLFLLILHFYTHIYTHREGRERFIHTHIGALGHTCSFLVCSPSC